MEDQIRRLRVFVVQSFSAEEKSVPHSANPGSDCTNGSQGSKGKLLMF